MPPSFHEMRGTLRIEIGCPSCGAALHRGKLLDGRDDAHLTHYQCEECLHYSLVLLFQTSMGISSMVLITDLCFEDVIRLRNKKPIAADDVLGIHELLEKRPALVLSTMQKKKV